jgi:hypothetical protein
MQLLSSLIVYMVAVKGSNLALPGYRCGGPPCSQSHRFSELSYPDSVLFSFGFRRFSC